MHRVYLGDVKYPGALFFDDVPALFLQHVFGFAHRMYAHGKSLYERSRVMARWVVWIMAGVACLFSSTHAEKVLRGAICDAETGEPLPLASVQVLGAYEGTIANAQGVYELAVRTVPATVQASYIGYRFGTLLVTDTTSSVWNFALAPAPIELAEMVVTAENQGPAIMRQVIAQKQVWRKQLETFQMWAYSRYTYFKEDEIAGIVESVSEAFWDRDQGWREVVKGRKETANLSLRRVLPAAILVANLYDDNIDIAGHTLMGVTHSDALDHYDFVLEGRRHLHDRWVYDISATPKNALQSAFEGRVSVLDSAYALVEVALKPNRAFLFPPPVQTLGVAFYQRFSNFGGDFYLPVDFRMDLDVKVGVIGLQFPVIRVQQISRFSDYQVNAALPDSLYAQKRVVMVDSGAVAEDRLLAREGVAVPLSESEAAAYAAIDSSMTLDRVFKPSGFLARFVGGDDGRRSGRQRGRGQAVEWRPEVWFNRVDGGHLGVQAKFVHRRFALSGSGAYNLGLRRWAFRGASTMRWGDQMRWFAGVSGFRGTETRYASGVYSQFVATFPQVFGADDYFDYFWRQGVRARLGRRLGTLTLSAGANVERHASVGKTTDWHLGGGTKTQRANPGIQAGHLRSATFKGILEGKDRGPVPVFGLRRIAVEIEHSRPGAMGSDFSFTRYQMMLDWRIETLFRRRFLPNVLDVRAVAQAHSGTLPVQRYGILDAGFHGFSTFGGFRTRVDAPLEGERVFGVFWEHHFRTAPFEWAGWRWAAERGVGLIIHGGHGRTWIADVAGLGHVPQYLDRFYHELGISVNGLFQAFRADFTKRLDGPGFYVGAGLARIF